eukprot:193766-Rhodomonas_salina.2
MPGTYITYCSSTSPLRSNRCGCAITQTPNPNQPTWTPTRLSSNRRRPLGQERRQQSALRNEARRSHWQLQTERGSARALALAGPDRAT